MQEAGHTGSEAADTLSRPPAVRTCHARPEGGVTQPGTGEEDPLLVCWGTGPHWSSTAAGEGGGDMVRRGRDRDEDRLKARCDNVPGEIQKQRRGKEIRSLGNGREKGGRVTLNSFLE